MNNTVDLRWALHELAARHGLDAQASRTLRQLSGLQDEPAALPLILARGLAVLAAALGGLGVVMWVAANWDTLGRFARFALLQGLVVVMCLGAARRPAARAPLGLLALLGMGGLLAFFGQTYQTGADLWILFALWAALALPLCLGVRSDVLWVPWSWVASTALSLWLHAHGGFNFTSASGNFQALLPAWALQVLLVAGLSQPLQRWTGAGPWAMRTAVMLLVVLLSLSALGGLIANPLAPQYGLTLLLMFLAVAVLCRPALYDVFALSAVVLALNTLLVAGFGRWLFQSDREPSLGALLLLGLAAAGLLAFSVSAVLRLVRRRRHTSRVMPVPRATESGSSRRAVSERLGELVLRAKAIGLLPAEAQAPQTQSRPWPVVLFGALGAWLAAVPLLVVVSAFLGGLLVRGLGAYVMGALVLGMATLALRANGLSLFLEQLALPALLVGLGSLGVGLFRDLPGPAALMLLACISLGLAWLIPKTWLRVLTGATAAVLLQWAYIDTNGWHQGVVELWGAAHAVLLLALGLFGAQSRWLVAGRQARLAQVVEPVAAGTLLAALLSLAAVSGMSFGLAGTLGPLGSLAGSALTAAPQDGWAMRWLPLGSVLAAGMGVRLARRAWPSLRAPVWLAVGLVLMALAGFVSALGAVLLALAACAVSHRWRLAAACGLTAAWVIGSLYYQLSWSLANKALLLVAAAAVLGSMAWVVLRPARAPGAVNNTVTVSQPGTLEHAALKHRSAQAPRNRWALACIGVACGAMLLVVNVAIRDKEVLISRGQPVFVALAPVDPRSLMQGDYMRLNFSLPDSGRQLPEDLITAQRPHVVARLDSRGVATLVRMHTPGDTLAANELRIELTPINGQWALVTDAWFFREGEGARWSLARFGEFRVTPDARALLVGMADAELRPISP